MDFLKCAGMQKYMRRRGSVRNLAMCIQMRISDLLLDFGYDGALTRHGVINSNGLIQISPLKSSLEKLLKYQIIKCHYVG